MSESLRLQIEVYRIIAKGHTDTQLRIIYEVIANELEKILEANYND